MRFVPTFCLRDGMLLSKSIYNENGSLLLKEGSYIKDRYIKKIIELGVQGVYIDDDISKDIEIQNVISDELRLKAVKKIKDMFISIENETFNLDEGLESLNLLMEDMVEELIENQDLMVNMIDIKIFDEYTFYHSVNVSVLSIIIGISLGLSKEELYNLGMGALLHDIGKVFVGKDIINKKEPLTKDEFEIIKTHPQEGYRYIKYQFQMPVNACVAVLQHHEKFDGSGYPNNRSGNDISLFGRIIAIADVYDALTSKRAYSDELLPSEAMEYIMGGSGIHFDFELVTLFIQKVAAYPVGTCVKLSDGTVGIVVENFPDASTRPKIKVIEDGEVEDRYINLRNDFSNNNLTIVEIVNM